MNDFERTLVKSFNKSFEEAGLTALAYRLKQSRFAPQYIDVVVDSGIQTYTWGLNVKAYQ